MPRPTSFGTAASLLLLLAGCSTVRTLDARQALRGKDLTTATNLYGRHDERVNIDGRSYYVWRRAVELRGELQYCELRVELGYRTAIRDTILDGRPAACSRFAVRYATDPGIPTSSKPDAAP
ncbi:hypothetical protein [Phenylobacterium sp.]|uniref:hypothetical protein n=1 Tax=Phenylobacterium sp. TaxID=1871053 RepID=UPI002F940BD9